MDAITYALSKKYTDNKVSQSTGLHREIVNSLPSTGDNNTIYMVLDPNASSPDVYDEWLWVNGTYEHIGSTRVDLTDYYNKTQVDTALNGSIKDVYKVLGQNGAKNLLDVGSEIHVVSISGVDIMFGGYGDITLDGTAQDDITYVLDADLGHRLNVSEHYIVSAGKTMDGSMSTYYLSIQEVHEGGATSSLADVTNDEVEFSKGSIGDIRCVLTIKSGTRLNLVSIDPMVRNASDTDDTHRPYAKTNKQLTEQLADAEEQIANLIKTKYLETKIATMAANSNTSATISLNVPTGYKVIGISEVLTSSSAIAVTGFYTQANSKLNINCANTSSVAVSNITVGVTVVYVRI